MRHHFVLDVDSLPITITLVVAVSSHCESSGFHGFQEEEKVTMAKSEQLQKMTHEIRLCVKPLRDTTNLKLTNAGRRRIAGIVRIAIAQFPRLKVVIPWFVVALIMEGISSLVVAPNSIGHLQSAMWLTFNAKNCQL
jgi:hypothetical protein